VAVIPDSNVTVIPIEDDETLVDTLSQLKNAYIFLTADWCNGGKVTFENSVYPYLDSLNQRQIPFIFVFTGNPDKYSFHTSGLIHSYSIFHLSDSWIKTPLTDKKRLANIVRELDSSYEFENKVPISIYIKDSKIESKKSLYEIIRDNKL
jgi:hypothetical protein